MKSPSSTFKVIKTNADLVRYGHQIKNITPFQNSKSEFLCEVEQIGYEKNQSPSNAIFLGGYILSLARDRIEDAIDAMKSMDPDCDILYIGKVPTFNILEIDVAFIIINYNLYIMYLLLLILKVGNVN